jgi:hypothetical protein
LLLDQRQFVSYYFCNGSDWIDLVRNADPTEEMLE